jgi:hypothetical protein
MAYAYTTLAFDDFDRNNENPLNPAVWSRGVLGGIQPCQIIDNEMVCTPGGVALESIAIYTGISWPNNQWVQCQIDNLVGGDGPQDNLGNAAILIELRRQRTGGQPASYGPAIAIEIDGNSEGTLGEGCGIVIFSGNNGGGDTYYLGSADGDALMTINPGSMLRLEAFNGTLSFFIDGVQVPLTNSTIDPTFVGGDVAIDLFYNTEVTDAQVSNFSAGTMTLAGGTGQQSPTPVTVANSSGHSLPITSPTLGSKLGQPTPVVFCDANGNELAVTGSTAGAYGGSPTPVVLCDSIGHPLAAPFVFTSNGNAITVSATKTGTKLGQPIPVVATDQNGNAFTLSGFTLGAPLANPTPIVLTDVNGNVLTLSGVTT